MRRAVLRKPKAEKFHSFPAPVGGWIANVNLSTPGARLADGTKVNGAALLENFFPTATGIRMRGGSEKYATIGDGTLDVTALFSYVNGNNRALFGATASALYDVTTVLSANDIEIVDDLGNELADDLGNILIKEASPAPSVISQTGGDWSVVQFATAGGTYLRAVNGADTPLVYDGSTWGTDPVITGATPTTLSNVWVFKNRMFFVQKDTLDAWYLPVDQIGGVAVKFPLGGVFTLGGALLFGAAWSLDTGAGLNEQCVFVTSEGEVAVYQGADPGAVSTFAKVGVYKIGKPRGPKAFIRAGGDIVIATDIGFVPLSQAIQRDVAALAPAAVSYPIEVAWNEAVEERTTLSWQCVVWPTKQMVLVALPTSSGQQAMIFVANARTGKWAPFTGWNATCMVTFGDRLFFGSVDGKIIEAEVTGADQGQTYTASVVPLFDPLKTPASLKTGLQARAVLRAPGRVGAQLSLQADYNIRLPAAPDDIRELVGDVWGTGVWGQAKWGGAAEKLTFKDWRSVPGSGSALSVATQITSGSISPPDVEIVQTDLTYELGEVGS